MPGDSGDTQLRAKRYSNRKYTQNILETAYSLAIMWFFAASGMSRFLADALAGFGLSRYLFLPAYILCAGIAFAAALFPFSFYGFCLERAFNLSRQRFGGWLADQLKAGMVGYVISCILLGAFYWILARYQQGWWIAVWLVWTVFSVILARLAPVVIIPLFFKQTPLQDEALRARILSLGKRMDVVLKDVFEIDFSRKTLKANAAFTGWGSTRRVLLADTLKNTFSGDEVEVVLAHEFAHYRMKHIWKLMLLNAAATLGGLFLIRATSPRVLAALNFDSLGDVASLPVVLVYFSLFGVLTRPLQALLSRAMERNADRAALAVTGNKGAFISVMEKLRDQNLADRDPHPLIKFYFFDHPPIVERIAMAEESADTERGR